MTHVLIHSPYAREAGQGNSVTADRVEAFLVESGHRVTHSQRDYAGQPADAMIALNARKSAKAIARFRYLHPQSGLAVVLTGTDINHPDVIDEKSETWISMKLADRLVVLHEAALRQVPGKFRPKTCVIYPSVVLPDGLGHTPEDGGFGIIMSGNMRREKNPALASAVAENLPGSFTIHHFGEARGLESDRVVRHGTVPHGEMLRAMAGSHALLNTSSQEGGANAVCEAVCLGLPVVASAVPGNVGMLGEDYPGLFAPDDLRQVVGLLEKAASDPAFYALLKRRLAGRAPLFSCEREADAWEKLLSGLAN